MVVISERQATPTSTAHERTARPSRWTVQAPHCATPHPNFVPLRPSTSRSAHSSGMSPSMSTKCSLPLTRSWKWDIDDLLQLAAELHADAVDVLLPLEPAVHGVEAQDPGVVERMLVTGAERVLGARRAVLHALDD